MGALPACGFGCLVVARPVCRPTHAALSNPPWAHLTQAALGETPHVVGVAQVVVLVYSKSMEPAPVFPVPNSDYY